MSRPIPGEETEAIEAAVRARPEGVAAREIAAALPVALPRRTLQYRLKRLVDAGRLVMTGTGRWARYAPPLAAAAGREAGGEVSVPLSADGAEVRERLRERPETEPPVGYTRDFLDSYWPNISAYLSPAERARLRELGRPVSAPHPAESQAPRLPDRLLVELAWNSSRLAGNTYSLRDARRLIEDGDEAQGHDPLEGQMILNHKDAIAFLVGRGAETGFDRHTMLNLHAVLASNLLPDEAAAGRLRRGAATGGNAAFSPLAVPEQIERGFDQLLTTAAAIEDPFEQALFVLAQISYLRPFDRANERLSRMAANIPLIKGDLCPLTFAEVAREAYRDAVLAILLLNRIELLKDVFVWAYERSAARLAALGPSGGAPDPFRLKHRVALRRIVGEVIRKRLDREAAAAHLAAWTQGNIVPEERDAFRALAEAELRNLHDGNYARYQVDATEFAAWQETWNGTGA